MTLTTSGQNITVYSDNGDKQGYTPDANNKIVFTSGYHFTVDPSSTDKIIEIEVDID